MKKLYVISGCNGAGKTTASYTVLPDILNCREFVNADEIAKGLSPFNPASMRIDAGRLMVERIEDLLAEDADFAIETTLATRTYAKLIQRAHERGYFVTLVYFWLESADLAVERVKLRVREGGHDIPEEDIRRRYDRGIMNFFNLYKPICDNWIFVDNSVPPFRLIATGSRDEIISLNDPLLFNKLQCYGMRQ